MEQLLHYVWKHKIFPLRQLTTTDGRTLDVLNPGIHNSNAGPDFIGACIKIDGTEWVGNVELHTHTSDWFRHHHDTDPAYSNIILHVAEDVDRPLFYPNGEEIPQLQLGIPRHVIDNYTQLSHADTHPRCKHILPTLPTIMIHNWMTTLALQRFEMRTKQIAQRRESLNGNWEDTLFVTMARNFGFGINGEAFELWAQSIPLSAVAKHRDDLFQIEAIFFGQAGFLEDTITPQGTETAPSADGASQPAPKDSYYCRLQREYRYLRHKFGLTPMDLKHWKFLRLRPQNFPHIRIAQLAMMYHEGRTQLARLIECDTAEKMAELLRCGVSGYWQDHYTFGHESRHSTKRLSQQSATLLMINCAIPMLFAYGRATNNDMLSDRALLILDSLHAEDNNITRMWRDVGLEVTSAGDSQALIQLKKEYCDRRRCTLCRIGDCHLSSEERGEGQGEYPKR